MEGRRTRTTLPLPCKAELSCSCWRLSDYMLKQAWQRYAAPLEGIAAVRKVKLLDDASSLPKSIESSFELLRGDVNRVLQVALFLEASNQLRDLSERYGASTIDAPQFCIPLIGPPHWGSCGANSLEREWLRAKKMIDPQTVARTLHWLKRSCRLKR